MKLISWNVNGIRSVLKKGFLDFVQKENPDMLCLQEARAPELPEEAKLSQYHQFLSAAEKKGYAGTAIWTKTKPLSVTYGMKKAKHDNEGRIITCEFKSFYLVTVYTPNSKRDLSRLPYRQKEWDVDFLKYVKRLEKKKPVVFCGDLNVAHKEIDLTHPKSNRRNHGFTDEEREGFDNFVKADLLDSFRVFNQDGGHYTWWSQFANCRARNIGWRIDYFLLSKSLRKRLKKAWIQPEVMGSDHCPVAIELSGKA